MTEVEIAFECSDCNTMYDEMDDGMECSVCDDCTYICENCQDEHGKEHCFVNCDAIYEGKKKK